MWIATHPFAYRSGIPVGGYEVIGFDGLFVEWNGIYERTSYKYWDPAEEVFVASGSRYCYSKIKDNTKAIYWTDLVYRWYIGGSTAAYEDEAAYIASTALTPPSTGYSDEDIELKQ